MSDNETSAQRVARAESELVDLEVRSPRLPDDVNEMCIVVAEMGGSQWRSTARYVIDRIRAQAAEVERLRAECERERMRLAACGVAANGGTVEGMDPAYDSASLQDVLRLRARVDEWKADHERAVALIDELTKQRDYAQESARLYEITYGEEGTQERTTLRAERDALRVRVAEFDKLAGEAAVWQQAGGLPDELTTAACDMCGRLAALAPRGPGDSEGGR
jgi:hypothetical protein